MILSAGQDKVIADIPIGETVTAAPPPAQK
jgi:hypothetical protein